MNLSVKILPSSWVAWAERLNSFAFFATLMPLIIRYLGNLGGDLSPQISLAIMFGLFGILLDHLKNSMKTEEISNGQRFADGRTVHLDKLQQTCYVAAPSSRLAVCVLQVLCAFCAGWFAGKGAGYEVIVPCALACCALDLLVSALQGAYVEARLKEISSDKRMVTGNRIATYGDGSLDRVELLDRNWSKAEWVSLTQEVEAQLLADCFTDLLAKREVYATRRQRKLENQVNA